MLVRKLCSEVSDGWWKLVTREGVDNVRGALDMRGLREMHLHKRFSKHANDVDLACSTAIDNPSTDMPFRSVFVSPLNSYLLPFRLNYKG